MADTYMYEKFRDCAGLRWLQNGLLWIAVGGKKWHAQVAALWHHGTRARPPQATPMPKPTCHRTQAAAPMAHGRGQFRSHPAASIPVVGGCIAPAIAIKKKNFGVITLAIAINKKQHCFYSVCHRNEQKQLRNYTACRSNKMKTTVL